MTSQHTARLPASLEVSPKQAVTSAAISECIPPGTHVYLNDMGEAHADMMVRGAVRLRQLGLEPVPHFAARRFRSHQSFQQRLAQLCDQADVRDVLVIGGGVAKPLGDFSSASALLETGEFDRRGINHIGIAGHPEGSPGFSAADAEAAMTLKRQLAARSDAEFRIVTQFGFDAQRLIDWVETLPQIDFPLPIHIGMAGPATLTTLIKFATLCGVGNSLDFIKKRSGTVSTLLAGFDPDTIAAPIEDHACSSATSPITQLHLFPFGGIERTAAWLVKRGNWTSRSA